MDRNIDLITPIENGQFDPGGSTQYEMIDDCLENIRSLFENLEVHHYSDRFQALLHGHHAKSQLDLHHCL